MTHINTLAYNKNTLNKFLNNENKNFIDTSKPYLLNDAIFDTDPKKITILSNMTTGSNTFVIRVNGRQDSKYKDKQFVVKYTPIDTLDQSYLLKSNNEFLIYKFIRNLIKDNICPFIYYGFMNEFIDNKDIDPYFLKQ